MADLEGRAAMAAMDDHATARPAGRRARRTNPGTGRRARGANLGTSRGAGRDRRGAASST